GKNYLLLGDSHAAHLWHGLSVAFPDVTFLQATAPGCRPLLGAKKARRCADLADFVFGDFLPSHRIDGVILAGRWQESDLARFPATIAALKSRNVIVVGPIIEYSMPLPMIISKALEHGPVQFGEFADRRTEFSKRMQA